MLGMRGRVGNESCVGCVYFGGGEALGPAGALRREDQNK